MKQFLIGAILALSTLFGSAQNGDQSNENSVIRIDYLGLSSGNYVFKITNKQPCQVSAQYTVANQILDITLPSNGFYTVTTPSSSGNVKARTRSFCGSNT